MIQQAYLHQFGGLPHTFGQLVVGRAGPCVARRVVVAEDETRGQGVDRLLEDKPQVGSCLAGSALADTASFDNLACLVSQGDPELLVWQVAQLGIEKLIDVATVADQRAFGGSGGAPAFPQLEGSTDGNRFGGSDALELVGQLLNGEFGKRVEVVVDSPQDLLGQRDGALLWTARADQDGDQLRVGQRLGPEGQRFLAWPIRFGPLLDG